MLKHRYYIFNWLIIAVVDFIYIINRPENEDGLRVIAGAFLIGGLFFSIGFGYLDNIFKNGKKKGDQEDEM